MTEKPPYRHEELYDGVIEELYKNVLPFWLEHSIDKERGGFFSCLDKNGELYDERKYMWLNGRQIWMFGRICLDVSSDDLVSLSDGMIPNKDVLLNCASTAADFMIHHGIREEDGLVYFSLAANGQPYHFERKIFSACFLCMGLGVLSAHTHLRRADQYKVEAIKLLHTVISLAHDPTPLGRPKCSGAPEVSPMNIPMILLNIIEELHYAKVIDVKDPMYSEEEAWCINEILKHVIADKKVVLENVHVNGSLLSGFDGRHMNPGHAIEAGWFVLSYANRVGRQDLKIIARNMIEWSFEAGWDKENGGLFYFLDSEGRSPPYLEWNMKLWWPHTEALIAYAMLYIDTADEHFWNRFVMIYDYTMSHFSDAMCKGGGGEWFGYLDTLGAPSHRFKGGPYKGCFHVPRALYFVADILHRTRHHEDVDTL